MTKDIVSIFKKSLLPYKTTGLISHLEGLVRVLEYKPAGDEKTRKIPYPVDCEEPEICKDCEGLMLCVPEKTKKCLVYFEGGQSREVASLEGATKYETVLSLVCWYNLGFFVKQDFLQTRMITLFSQAIKETFARENGLAPISFLNPEIISVTDSDSSIFSKYSYSEVKSNFLGCKYGAFKIDFKIKFITYENQNCINDIMGAINNTCD